MFTPTTTTTTNNNNRYLERLTRTGPSAYIFFKCTRFQDLVHTAHTHTQTGGGGGGGGVVYQGSDTEEKFFEKRKVFREDLKELTEVK